MIKTVKQSWLSRFFVKKDKVQLNTEPSLSKEQTEELEDLTNLIKENIDNLFPNISLFNVTLDYFKITHFENELNYNFNLIKNSPNTYITLNHKSATGLFKHDAFIYGKVIFVGLDEKLWLFEFKVIFNFYDGEEKDELDNTLMQFGFMYINKLIDILHLENLWIYNGVKPISIESATSAMETEFHEKEYVLSFIPQFINIDNNKENHELFNSSNIIIKTEVEDA